MKWHKKTEEKTVYNNLRELSTSQEGEEQSPLGKREGNYFQEHKGTPTDALTKEKGAYSLQE